MSPIKRGSKTFNNCLSFEQHFWQPELDIFSSVPKASALERSWRYGNMIKSGLLNFNCNTII